MIKVSKQQEQVIMQVLEMLSDKHDALPVEQYAYYVVKGEHEEDCGGDNYCEKCIPKAVRESRDRHNRKRAQQQLYIRDLKKNGYSFVWSWDPVLNNKFLRIVWAKEYKQVLALVAAGEKVILEKFPAGVDFSYRRYQLGSESSFSNCSNCGMAIKSYVTADAQEILHWQQPDADYIVSNMTDGEAYCIYEWVQFIHQAKEPVFEIGMSIIDRIISVNKKQ